MAQNKSQGPLDRDQNHSFMGSSPGFKLLRTLSGHTDAVNRIAWSPNGRWLASPSFDRTVRIWNPFTGEVIRVLKGHNSEVYSLAWSANSEEIASGSEDGRILIWNVQHNISPVTLDHHKGRIEALAWSPDGETIASASADSTICLWSASSFKRKRTLLGHSSWVNGVAWSPDSTRLVSGAEDNRVIVWNTTSPIYDLNAHTAWISDVDWSIDGRFIASASHDQSIIIWEAASGKLLHVLEGHTDHIRQVAFSNDTRFLVSKAADQTIRVWDCLTWKTVAVLQQRVSHDFNPTPGFALHPNKPILASVDVGKNISIWELQYDIIFDSKVSVGTEISFQYTNAKVVLIGDTGVGKSGLALVLTGQRYVPTDSTHGRQVHLFESATIELPSGSKERREILLWDLAGQPGYRIVHQLSLTEVAVAVICFDARSTDDPFDGVRYWANAIRQAQRVNGGSEWQGIKLLVSTRIDRGIAATSQEQVAKLKQQLGFDEYFETSAKEGWGTLELTEGIRRHVDWDKQPRVSSTDLFIRIKDFLIACKEEGRLLTTSDALYDAFLGSNYVPASHSNFRKEFDTVITRVESRGLLRRLSFGNLILLQPEILDTYAASILFAAREDPKGLGAISESNVRMGKFRKSATERISEPETEKLLLIATIEDLIRHELAFIDEGDLIFPSQLMRVQPNLSESEEEIVVFSLHGAPQSIYARLAVRLTRSGIFKLHKMWRDAISFQTATGSCGIRFHESADGCGELTLFFAPEADEVTRFHFEQYVEAYLARWALPGSLTRRRIFSCSKCGAIMDDKHVRARRERGLLTMQCPVCDATIHIGDREERLGTPPESKVPQMNQAADIARDLEASQSILAGKVLTKDFDVFLCHHDIDKPSAKVIGNELRHHGILPWLDEWELRPGLPWQRLLEQQIGKIKSAAVFVGKSGIGPWQNIELEAFIREFVKRNLPVIPVILPDCPVLPQLPIILESMTWVDFRVSDPDPMERLIWGITGRNPR